MACSNIVNMNFSVLNINTNFWKCFFFFFFFEVLQCPLAFSWCSSIAPTTCQIWLLHVIERHCFDRLSYIRGLGHELDNSFHQKAWYQAASPNVVMALFRPTLQNTHSYSLWTTIRRCQTLSFAKDLRSNVKDDVCTNAKNKNGFFV